MSGPGNRLAGRPASATDLSRLAAGRAARTAAAGWTAERDAALTELWADHGLSASEIGTRICVTKNSVIGRARRLQLPPRQTPIGLTTITAHRRAQLDAAGGWTEGRVLMLRRLWDAGVIAADIGRRLDITKTAVLGKARALGLPRRPSPIIRRAPRATRPASTGLTAAAAPVATRTRADRPCCWPVSKGRSCDAPSVERKPVLPLPLPHGVSELARRLMAATSKAKPWTDAARAEAMDLRRQGLSDNAIAERLGRDRSNVARTLGKAAPPISPVGRVAEDTGRGTDGVLPVGSPVSWGCISAAPWPQYEPVRHG